MKTGRNPLNCSLQANRVHLGYLGELPPPLLVAYAFNLIEERQNG